ncbi:response regulator transcription factor [Streptomyces sp. NBC_00038]|uniref:helix-turn-helix transcriptional regulator n=1 Tax=Streptomyces sp. NBC_00038 TaxID=2903615 RepID=UPI002259269F|nr:response regulator transcription factor [Streptomyces sp. NBC_00038]MCX5555767.1 response regulator transcription factor [Streptomyces sp. NBC_00038]
MSTRLDESDLKIALILENEVRRYGVEGMLRCLGGISGVTCFGSGDEALRAGGAAAFDLVVISAAELAATEDPAVAEQLSAHDVRLLLLVDGADGVEVPQSTHSCVHALVDWSGLTPRVFGDAVSDIMAGKFYVSATLARRVLRQAGPLPAEARPWGPPGTMLTPRELQVLHLVAEGLSNKQAARRLQISEHGVKRLVGNVLAKLNCPNRTLAVVRAIEDGLLAGPSRETGRQVDSATSVA